MLVFNNSTDFYLCFGRIFDFVLTAVINLHFEHEFPLFQIFNQVVNSCRLAYIGLFWLVWFANIFFAFTVLLENNQWRILQLLSLMIFLFPNLRMNYLYYNYSMAFIFAILKQMFQLLDTSAFLNCQTSSSEAFLLYKYYFRVSVSFKCQCFI